MNDKKEIIERLEKRKISFKFCNNWLLLFVKGKLDSRKGKVQEEIDRRYSLFNKFIEEELKNLETEILESLIIVKTADDKLSRAKATVDSPREPVKYSDERKQKRENTRVNKANINAMSQYASIADEVNEEKAFIDTAVGIISRLIMSAYHYTNASINNYLKYVDADVELNTESFEEVYSDLVNNIMNGGDHIEE